MLLLTYLRLIIILFFLLLLLLVVVLLHLAAARDCSEHQSKRCQENSRSAPHASPSLNFQEEFPYPLALELQTQADSPNRNVLIILSAVPSPPVAYPL